MIILLTWRALLVAVLLLALPAIVLGGLYAMALLLEPEERSVSTTVPGMRVRK